MRALDESVTEFGGPGTPELGWRVVDDGVMGGLSKGRIAMTDQGTMRFQGDLSLENNGGFSSVRTGELDLDLSGFEGVAVRARGDGRTYQVRLGTDATFRSMEMAFKAEFETRDGEWTEVRVPFGEFVGTFRGRLIPDVECDPSNVRRLGFLLADEKAGAFSLEIDWVRGFNGGNGLVKKPRASVAQAPECWSGPQ